MVGDSSSLLVIQMVQGEGEMFNSDPLAPVTLSTLISTSTVNSSLMTVHSSRLTLTRTLLAST